MRAGLLAIPSGALRAGTAVTVVLSLASVAAVSAPRAGIMTVSPLTTWGADWVTWANSDKITAEWVFARVAWGASARTRPTARLEGPAPPLCTQAGHLALVTAAGALPSFLARGPTGQGGRREPVEPHPWVPLR